MGHGVLTELVIVLATAVATVLLLRRLHVSATAGFIVAGVLVGPGGLGLIEDRRGIEQLAEIGVMLLLFTVGLKLSLRALWRMRRVVFGLGTLQVVATAALTSTVVWLLGVRPATALLAGYLAALSSTAVVLRDLEESDQLHTPHGRAMLGALLLQDLAVVPMMFSLPLIQRAGVGRLSELLRVALESLGLLAAIGVGARLLFPWLARRIAYTRSRELFTITTILVALSTALLVGQAGLSMALGAFLAGVVVAESPYSQQILADITPLRDALGGVFLVSIGMLVEPALWLRRPVWLAAVFVGLVVGKAGVAALAAGALRLGARTALLTAAGLAHVGEFAFVVAYEGMRLGLLDAAGYQLFVSVAAPTMMLTPFAVEVMPRLVRRLPVGRPARGVAALALVNEPLQHHLIVVGYGTGGERVTRTAQTLGIPTVVVELNPHTVQRLRRDHRPALFGDAHSPVVLRHVGVEVARALVVSIPDTSAAGRIAAVARQLNTELLIVVRARFSGQAEGLRALGADEVVVEEEEAAQALATRVLQRLGAEVTGS